MTIGQRVFDATNVLPLATTAIGVYLLIHGGFNFVLQDRVRRRWLTVIGVRSDGDKHLVDLDDDESGNTVRTEVVADRAPKIGCTMAVLYDPAATPAATQWLEDTGSLENMLRQDRLGQSVCGALLVAFSIAWLLYYHLRRRKSDRPMQCARP